MAGSSPRPPSMLFGSAVFLVFAIAAVAGAVIKAREAGWVDLSPAAGELLGNVLVLPGPSLLAVIVVWPETPAWWPMIELVCVVGLTLLIGALLGFLASRLERITSKLVWTLVCAVLLYPVGWVASSYVGLLTFAGRTLVIEDPSRPEVVFLPGLIYTMVLTALMAGSAIGLRWIEAWRAGRQPAGAPS